MSYKAILGLYSSLKDSRVLMVRYEDLVNDQERSLLKISSFLKVDADYNLDTISNNSSYSNNNSGISTQKKNAWKDKLTNEQIFQIESFCFDYMDEFGYNLISDANKRINLRLARIYLDKFLGYIGIRPFTSYLKR